MVVVGRAAGAAVRSALRGADRQGPAVRARGDDRGDPRADVGRCGAADPTRRDAIAALDAATSAAIRLASVLQAARQRDHLSDLLDAEREPTAQRGIDVGLGVERVRHVQRRARRRHRHARRRAQQGGQCAQRGSRSVRQMLRPSTMPATTVLLGQSGHRGHRGDAAGDQVDADGLDRRAGQRGQRVGRARRSRWPRRARAAWPVAPSTRRCARPVRRRSSRMSVTSTGSSSCTHSTPRVGELLQQFGVDGDQLVAAGRSGRLPPSTALLSTRKVTGPTTTGRAGIPWLEPLSARRAPWPG